ncbi:unnamed protein product [Ascophyllum nodosum]
MIHRVRLCELGGRPAAAVSRARARCERASSAAPTSKTEEAVAPPPNTRSPSTPLEGEGGTGGFAAGQWRPSEAHKTSATAIRREKVASINSIQAGVAGTSPVTADGRLETRPAGLRRRALLGGAKEEKLPPPQHQQQRNPGWSTLLTTTSGESRSVASMSATQRFRRRRELERLASAGSLEAAEALRASEAASESAHEGDGTGSEGVLTPLKMLPVLLAVVAAGYGAAVSGLVPSRLPSIGDGSGGFGGARSEGQRDLRGVERGDNEGASRPSRINREGDNDAGVDEKQQQRPRASCKASPVVKTCARADPGDRLGRSADGGGFRDADEAWQRPPLWLKLKDSRAPEPPRST